MADKSRKCVMPRCGGRVVKADELGWWTCKMCGAMYDDEPDEGGTHADDPVYSLIRKEQK